MPKICRTCSAFRSSMTACPPLISVTDQAPFSPLPLGEGWGEGLHLANLHTIFFQGIIPQFKSQARLVRQRHMPIDDLRALTEQLEPQRIARRISKGFENKPGRARRLGVDVDLRVMMRGHRYVV